MNYIFYIHGYSGSGKTTLIGEFKTISTGFEIFTVIGDDIRKTLHHDYFSWFDRSNDGIVFNTMIKSVEAILKAKKNNVIILVEDYNFIKEKAYEHIKLPANTITSFVVMDIPKAKCIANISERLAQQKINIKSEKAIRWYQNILSQEDPKLHIPENAEKIISDNRIEIANRLKAIIAKHEIEEVE